MVDIYIFTSSFFMGYGEGFKMIYSIFIPLIVLGFLAYKRLTRKKRKFHTPQIENFLVSRRLTRGGGT